MSNLVLRCCIWSWVTLRMLPVRPDRAQTGQSLTEAALVIAVIGVVCIPSMTMLREAIAAAYTTHQQALSTVSATATPVR